MKISSLIFGIIFASLLMSSFGIFISQMSNDYGVTWDNSSIETYNKLNETRTQADELQTKIDAEDTDTSIVDILGSFVTKAVDSLKLTYRSLGAAMSMVETGTDDVGLPKQYKTALVTALIVFVILGVIISVMVKKDV